MNEVTTEAREWPSPEEFFLRVPLYKEFTFNDEWETPDSQLKLFQGTLDVHCHGCGRHSVFRHLQSRTLSSGNNNRVFVEEFMCSRDLHHKLEFVFRADKGVLQKIGQFPSLADLVTADLKKYREILGNERFRELSRGIGLVSHGIGAGAFVYLRRVFESLIEEARGKAATISTWDNEAFALARMDDKILLLQNLLPNFLVENRSMYGIMSLGVHELSDAKCLEAFPVVKLGIELILDELLEKHTRDKKIADAKKNISVLGSTLKKT